MIIDSHFELKVLACLCKVQQFAVIAHRHLQTEYFSDKNRQWMCYIASNFYKKYGTLISDTAFKHYLSKLYTDKKINKAEVEAIAKLYHHQIQTTDVSDHEFILENLILFIRKSEIQLFIERTVKSDLPAEKFDNIEKQMHRILNIKVTSDAEPYEYWEEIDTRNERRTEEAVMKELGIPTGIKKLDNVLHKQGWYKGELYLIVGPPKRGKTMSLIWFADYASLLGYNIAYFTLEVSKDVISDRLDALNSGIETYAVKHKIKEVKSKIETLRKKAGKLTIFDYPAQSLSPRQINADLERMEQKGIVYDMVVVDYADIMAPDYRTDNHWIDEGNIYVSLRDIAKNRQLPLLTASHVGKSNRDKTFASGGDTAGSYDKIKHADLVMTLNATDEEVMRNEIRIYVSESRNGASTKLKIKTDFSRGKFYEELIEEMI